MTEYPSPAAGESKTCAKRSLLEVIEHVCLQLPDLRSMLALCLSSKTSMEACFSHMTDQQLQQLLRKAVMEHPYVIPGPQSLGWPLRQAASRQAISWLLCQCCARWGIVTLPTRLDLQSALAETKDDAELCAMLISAGARFHVDHLTRAAHTYAPASWLAIYKSLKLASPTLPPLAAAVCAWEHMEADTAIAAQQLLPAEQLQALAPQEALALAKLTLSIISHDSRSVKLLEPQLTAWQCPADELQQLLVVAAWQGKCGFCLQHLLGLPAAGALPRQCYEDLLLVTFHVHSSSPHRMPSSSRVVEASLRSVWRNLEVAASAQLVQRLEQVYTRWHLWRDGDPFDCGVCRFARLCGPVAVEASAVELVRQVYDGPKLEQFLRRQSPALLTEAAVARLLVLAMEGGLVEAMKSVIQSAAAMKSMGAATMQQVLEQDPGLMRQDLGIWECLLGFAPAARKAMGLEVAKQLIEKHLFGQVLRRSGCIAGNSRDSCGILAGIPAALREQAIQALLPTVVIADNPLNIGAVPFLLRMDCENSHAALSEPQQQQQKERQPQQHEQGPGRQQEQQEQSVHTMQQQQQQCTVCSLLSHAAACPKTADELDVFTLLIAAAQSPSSKVHIAGLQTLPGIKQLDDEQVTRVLNLCLQRKSGADAARDPKLEQLLDLLGPRQWAVAAVHKLMMAAVAAGRGRGGWAELQILLQVQGLPEGGLEGWEGELSGDQVKLLVGRARGVGVGECVGVLLGLLQLQDEEQQGKVVVGDLV